MEQCREEANSIISKCDELVEILTEWERGTADMCGEDDDICYKPLKEILQKMIEVRDLVRSEFQCVF